MKTDLISSEPRPGSCYPARSIRASNSRFLAISCVAAVFLVASAHAETMGVFGSGQQYSTYTCAEGDLPEYPPVTNTLSSVSPISDRLAFPYWGPGLTNEAIASAGLFDVFVVTGPGKADASATSLLRFSPLMDSIQSIGIGITNLSSHGPFTAGSVRLFDVTANTDLWWYKWDLGHPNEGNIPWNDPEPSPDSGTADFLVLTSFLASHQYELTLMAASSARDDWESVRISVSGLTLVPEPTAAGLGLLAVALLAASRKRK